MSQLMVLRMYTCLPSCRAIPVFPLFDGPCKHNAQNLRGGVLGSLPRPAVENRRLCKHVHARNVTKMQKKGEGPVLPRGLRREVLDQRWE